MSDKEEITGVLPPQPPTAKLEAVPQWAVELSRNVVNIRGNVEILTGDMTTMKLDIRQLQQFRLDTESAAAKTVTSERVRAMVDEQPSRADLEQQAQLAQERVAREELAGKVDALTHSQEVQLAILSRLDKLATNPHVKLILAVVATALMSWAASKGLGK